MQVQVINSSYHELPRYETSRSAGVDVRCSEKWDTEIPPGGTALVGTGLFVSIPVGYEIQVRPRSGLALKHGVTVLNSPGTIDADYRGEIKVILINHGKDIFTIKTGDRIGQLVLNKIEQIEWLPVTKLDITERGEGGFGSTGKQ